MDRLENSDEVFLRRTYNMVDDPATDSIVSWSQSGKTFIVWNPVEFTTSVMFNHPLTNMLPGILSIYYFRRVGSEINEYANDNFVRGQPHLLKNIRSRRPGFFLDQKDMINLINILTMEKEELLAELQKQDVQIKALKHRLQHIGISRL